MFPGSGSDLNIFHGSGSGSWKNPGSGSATLVQMIRVCQTKDLSSVRRCRYNYLVSNVLFSIINVSKTTLYFSGKILICTYVHWLYIDVETRKTWTFYRKRFTHCKSTVLALDTMKTTYDLWLTLTEQMSGRYCQIPLLYCTEMSLIWQKTSEKVLQCV